MKVLQLIDSLQAGGAERMAVNLANALHPIVERSYLCVTRKEGPLNTALAAEVGYLFLGKKRTVDFKALRRLRVFLQQEGITHLHAHGTSFFLATLMKWRLPHLKLIYHEHHGKRVEETSNDNKVLGFCSRFFDAVITVNESLSEWSKKNLHCKKVYYRPNFISEASFLKDPTVRKPHIVHLANLRPVKDQVTLIKAFSSIHEQYPEWRLLLVGKAEDPSYLDQLEVLVKEENLTHKVQFLGVQPQVSSILQEAGIGVLSSLSEGLPMALLEYGAAGLPVVATEVGYCAAVVSNYGKIVPSGAVLKLAEALRYYIDFPEARNNMAHAYKNHIFETYASQKIVLSFIEIYKTIT